MKKILLLLVTLLCWSTENAWTQVSSYIFSQTIGTYTPITGGTVIVDGTSSLTNYTSPLQSMPSYTFNGTTFTSFVVNSNGSARLGNPYMVTFLPFTTSLDKVNSNAATNIRYETIGNETVIQWTQFKRTGCNESFDFQIRMNNVDGSVSYVYQLNMIPDAATTNQPALGIGTNSTIQYNYRTVSGSTGNWDASVLATSNSDKCRFTSNSINPRYFTTGQTYTWSPSTCPFGYGTLSVANQSSTSVSVAWQGGSPGDYLLEYGPAGFTPGTGTVPGLNGTIVDPAVLPLTISGLNTNTYYDIYYRKNCTSSSNGYSINSQVVQFKTGYCTFSSVNPNYYISNFSTTGAVTNVSNLNSGYSPTGYQDTSSSMVITVNRGDSVSYQVQYAGGSNTNLLGAWVDWNSDCIFAPGETVLSTTGDNPANRALVIPASTPTGDYRMRVSFTYYAFSAYACGSFSGTGPSQPGGEAEDYILRIINSSCKRPVNITAGFPTDNSITLSWNNNGATPSNNYDIYYSTSNVPPNASTLPTLTNQVSGAVISGLPVNTSYYAWVRANCGAEQSTWGWPVKFTTACTTVSDYFESFGPLTNSTFPDCFINLPAYYSEIFQGQLYLHGSTVTLRPVNNAGSNTHWLRFKMRGIANSKLRVGYMTNPLDTATFNLIQEVTVLGNTFQTYTVDPGTLPDTNKVLAVKAGTGSMFIDSMYWEVKPACLPPSNVMLSQPTDVSGYITWTNPTALPANNFDIYYSTTNVAPVNATTPTLTNQTANATISGLNPNSTYYFWVRSNCGGGAYSSWIPGNTLSTYCTSVSSYFENFDGVPTPPMGSPILPACFLQTSPYMSTSGYSAPNCALLGNNTTIGLRPVNNATANTHWLRFQAKANSSALNDSITVGYLTNPANLNTFVRLQSFGNPTTTFNEYYFDPGTALPPSPNSVLAIRITGPNPINAYVYIDDVTWEAKPACIFVSNVTTGTPTQTTNTVSWTAIASQPPSNNYDIYYSTDPTAPTAVSTPNLTNQVSGAVISGLDPGTTYYVWVRSNCGSTQTVWTGPGTFTTVYAPPVNDNAPGAVNLTLGSPCSGASYSSMGATTTASEPYPSCSSNKIAPVWFKLIAPPSGAVRVYSTSGTATSAKMALFSATDSSDYSTFTLISCDGRGGNATGTLSNGNNSSVLYATGLTSGATYYIAFDGFTTGDPLGTFCVRADEFSVNMLSATNNCSSGYQGIPSFNTSYTGWYSILDNSGNVLAMVKQPAGGSPNYFSGAQNVYTGTVRTDGNGTPYLNRNWFIRNTISITATDVMLFFTDAEFQSLKTADPSINTLNDLFIIKVPHSAVTNCLPDFGNGQINTVITPTGSGTSADGLVHWLSFTTPSFSNFFIKGGSSPLPVQLVDFKGSKANSSNLLSWNFICDDDQALAVALERNEDGKSKFTTIHQSVVNDVNCGKYIDYEDRNLSSTTQFYRLRYTTPDSKVKFSKVIALTSDNKAFELIDVVPNPAHNSAILHLLSGGNGRGMIRITDVAGRLVQDKTVALMKGSNSIALNTTSFGPGLYIISIMDESGNKRSVKLVKE